MMIIQSSDMIFRNLKIIIHNTIVQPQVLYVSEIWLFLFCEEAI
jgi:hypothetical protein